MFGEKSKKYNTILSQMNVKITEYDTNQIFEMTDMSETEKFNSISKCIDRNILDELKEI